MVIALLTIPPYIAEKYTKSLVQMMFSSCGMGMVFTSGGLWISYRFDLTSGAAIIFLAGVAFFLSLVLDRLIVLNKRRLMLKSHREMSG